MGPFDEGMILWISPGDLRETAKTHRTHNYGKIVGDLAPRIETLGPGIWIWEGFVKGVYHDPGSAFPEDERSLDYIDYEGSWREPEEEEWCRIENRVPWKELMYDNATEKILLAIDPYRNPALLWISPDSLLRDTIEVGGVDEIIDELGTPPKPGLWVWEGTLKPDFCEDGALNYVEFVRHTWKRPTEKDLTLLLELAWDDNY